MKKLFISLTLVLLLGAGALPHLALAQAAEGTAAYQALEQFNEFLQGNEQYGTTYINSQLKKVKTAAHEGWDDSAALYDFTLYAPVDKDPYCEFRLSAIGNDANDFLGSCTADETPLTELTDNNAAIGYQQHIYGVGFLMRDLVPAMMNDEKLMAVFADLFKEEVPLSLTFNLSKNSSGRLMWTVTFTNDADGEEYYVKTSAETNEDPFFMILHKRSS